RTATYTFPNLPQGVLPDGTYSATIDAGVIHNSGGLGLFNYYSVVFSIYQGDANHDGVINGLDFSILASNYGRAGAGFDGGDFNYDGTVSSADFSLLAGRFNGRFAGPAMPSLLFAPGGALAPPSGAAAPAPLPAQVFSAEPRLA